MTSIEGTRRGATRRFGIGLFSTVAIVMALTTTAWACTIGHAGVAWLQITPNVGTAGTPVTFAGGSVGLLGCPWPNCDNWFGEGVAVMDSTVYTPTNLPENFELGDPVPAIPGVDHAVGQVGCSGSNFGLTAAGNPPVFDNTPSDQVPDYIGDIIIGRVTWASANEDGGAIVLAGVGTVPSGASPGIHVVCADPDRTHLWNYFVVQ